MDNDTKRPNAALINREWYLAAKSVLQYGELCHVVNAACCYVLFGDIGVNLSEREKLAFAMIRPALDSDVDKYVERCARNAANARSQSQRVAASGTQSQRVGANTTTTSTTTSTTTTTSTPSLSPEISEEKERWIIFGYFWSTGSKAISQELDAFWSYYESLGWKNNKGAAIVSKVACARMWKRQFESGTAPNGADAWYKSVQSCEIADYGVFNCYLGAEREESGAVVRLRCKSSFLESLKAAVPNLERILQSLWRVPAVRFETAGA